MSFLLFFVTVGQKEILYSEGKILLYTCKKRALPGQAGKNLDSLAGLPHLICYQQLRLYCPIIVLHSVRVPSKLCLLRKIDGPPGVFTSSI